MLVFSSSCETAKNNNSISQSTPEPNKQIHFNKSKFPKCFFFLSPKQCGWESAKELRVTRVKTQSITERAFIRSDWSVTGI